MKAIMAGDIAEPLVSRIVSELPYVEEPILSAIIQEVLPRRGIVIEAKREELSEMDGNILFKEVDVVRDGEVRGNNVAMRTALEEIEELTPILDVPEDKENPNPLVPSHSVVAVKIRKLVRETLATPARNCDRHFKNLNEAQRFYIEWGCPKGLGAVVDGPINKVPWKSNFEKWLFEPTNAKKESKRAPVTEKAK